MNAYKHPSNLGILGVGLACLMWASVASADPIMFEDNFNTGIKPDWWVVNGNWWIDSEQLHPQNTDCEMLCGGGLITLDDPHSRAGHSEHCEWYDEEHVLEGRHGMGWHTVPNPPVEGQPYWMYWEFGPDFCDSRMNYSGNVWVPDGYRLVIRSDERRWTDWYVETESQHMKWVSTEEGWAFDYEGPPVMAPFECWKIDQEPVLEPFPEPATLALVGLGALVLSHRRR